MSKEDEFLEIGKITAEYAEARKRLTLLLSKARQMSNPLYLVNQYLSPMSYSNTDLSSGGKVPDLSAYPTAEQLSDLFNETLEVLARKKELHAQLKAIGAEPKD